MHCFIGIEIDPPLSDDIIDLQKRWRDLNLPPADFHKHTNPHITLVPPFECKDTRPLISELKEIGGRFPQFNLVFLHVSAFNRRILHLAVDSNATVALRADLIAACAGFTRVHDSNPFFHPHTTIGYSHQPLGARDLSLAALTLENALRLPRRQTVTSFVLFGRDKPGTNYHAESTILLSDKTEI